MNLSISFFYYIISFVVLLYFKFFGVYVNDNLGVISIVVMGLSFLLGCIFFKLKICDYKLIIKSKRTLNNISILVSIFIIILCFYVITIKGFPPIYYSLFKQNVPRYIISGQYRNSLPIKAVILPLSLINVLVGLMFIKDIRKVNFLLSLVSLFLCAGVYDSRHMLIWIVIYYFMYKYPNVANIKRINRKTICYCSILILIFYIYFIFVGDSRVDIKYDESQRFALSMGVDYKYSHLNMPIIWAIIYLFANLANGIVNDSFVPILNTNIPKQFLPGFFQQFLNNDTYNPNRYFSKYAFGLDGWHDLCLNIGMLPGIVTILFLTIIELYLIRIMNRQLYNNKCVPNIVYILNLYILTRLFLLPFGCYIYDLGGYMEVLYLILFFKLANVKIMNNKEEL